MLEPDLEYASCEDCGSSDVWNKCGGCGCDLCFKCENEHPTGSGVFYCYNCYDEIVGE